MTSKYRSKLEARLHTGPLKGCLYEPIRRMYPRPWGLYIPDFVVPDKEVWIEVKGYFTSADRTKMLSVQKQYPMHQIRFVFQTPNKTLSPRSMTTYAQWAEKHGFPWCDAKDTETLARWAKGEL